MLRKSWGSECVAAQLIYLRRAGGSTWQKYRHLRMCPSMYGYQQFYALQELQWCIRSSQEKAFIHSNSAFYLNPQQVSHLRSCLWSISTSKMLFETINIFIIQFYHNRASGDNRASGVWFSFLLSESWSSVAFDIFFLVWGILLANTVFKAAFKTTQIDYLLHTWNFKRTPESSMNIWSRQTYDLLYCH